MPKFIHSFQAQKDLDEIWHFIALDNVVAADKLIDTLAEKCARLSSAPEMGEKRPDLGDALRCFSAGNYVIFFRPISEGIEIVRVLHGVRDTKKSF
jgi:toxin ParE1/3/4